MLQLSRCLKSFAWTPLAFGALLAIPTAASSQTLAAPAQPSVDTEREAVQLVRVTLRGPDDLRLLTTLGLDLSCGVSVLSEDGLVRELAAGPAELAALNALDLEHSVVVPDLVAHFQSRFATQELAASAQPSALGAGLTPPFGMGSLGGYYTWTEVGSVLDQLTSAHPSITTDKVSLGATDEGRQLWMVKISDNPDVDENEPEFRIDSMHHAREPQSMQSTLWFMIWLLENYGSDPLATYLVNEREIYAIPVVNPDGYAYNQAIEPGGGGLWRKNRVDNGNGTTGVDLNRNYPYFWGFDNVGSSPSGSSDTYRGPSPGSELETQHMVAFMNARDFGTAISAHAHGNLWLTPWGYDGDAPLAEMAQYDEINAAAAPPGWLAGSGEALLGYTANGSTNDEDQGNHGILSWTPEIGDSADNFWPPTDRIIPLAEETLPGLQATALAAGAFVRLMSVLETEEGDGDGFPEAGEALALRLELRNSGLDATLGGVDLTVTSSSPHVSVVVGATSLPSLGSFSSDDNTSSPLRLAIHASAPSGTVVDYELGVSAEGYTQLIPRSFVIGKSRPFLFDDVEVDLGWIAGVPGDTASAGLWERDDPLPVSSDGDQLQPADDHTPGAGTQAFITGNANTSPGSDDVDNGTTTLISPAFDLAGVGTARLSYARWYIDLLEPDDVFEISLSNDDGQNWTPLETVTGEAPGWSTPEFVVADVLPHSDAMRLRFVADDDPNNSWVEALVDDLRIDIFDVAPRINLYGDQALGEPLRLNLSAEAGSPFTWFLSPFTADLQIGLIQGHLLLDPGNLFTVFSNTVPAGDLHSIDLTMPTDPTLAGVPLYVQAFVLQGGVKYLSNRETLELE